MAAWQFGFSIIPAVGILAVHGKLVPFLPEYRMRDFDAPLRDESEFENYWIESEALLRVGEELSCLLPERRSWSSEARMFGDEDRDGIEVWNDDINCAIDVRRFDPALLRAMLAIARAAECKIVLKDDGRVIDPDFDAVVQSIRQSRAMEFVVDPVAFITQRPTK